MLIYNFVFGAIKNVFFFCVVSAKNALLSLQCTVFTKQMQCTRFKVACRLEHK